MVPNSITLLEQMPLTPNGKIDRKALSEPEQMQGTGTAIPPRDLIECELLSIWQQVLGTDQLGIQDDFFAAGGHSLLAMRLVSLIRQQFDVQLPVAVLFQNTTVAALAGLIRQAETVSLPTWSNCVPMQTRGEQTPLYILPGAVGSVLYLQPLAAALGQQQPIYALQTLGLQPDEVTPDTVEALAAYHLAAIREQQPDGPYCILGHSSGGRVAFELAHQLEAAGATVAFLGILDTSAPDPQHDWQDPQDDGSDAYQLWSLLQVFTELTGQTTPYTLSDLQALEVEQAYVQVLGWLQQCEIVFTAADTVATLQRWVQTYRMTTQGHATYETQAHLTCPIHLFRASEQTHEPDAAAALVDDRPHWGWGAHAQVHEAQVPGTHVTMMVRPQVQSLAEAIRACLA
jgi:thioesterase domain-containing protein/acyl carrier protein